MSPFSIKSHLLAVSTQKRPHSFPWARAARSVNALLLAIIFCSSSDSLADAEPFFVDSFEGPLANWKISHGDAVLKVLAHERVRSPVHSGSWSETIRVFGKNGSYAYAAYDIGRAHVIDELTLAVWLRSDRIGLQMAAQVVLPRTWDPETGKPMTFLIFGTMYQDAGRWQQLFVDKVPQRVARQARILRSGDFTSIDDREAYIERVLINVYGGQGITNVWIDDISIQGFVGHTADQDITNPSASPGELGSRDGLDKMSVPSVTKVRFRESLLTVAGKPFFPRVIQHQGEPFDWLQSLGFNAIQLHETPSPDQLQQAARLGLWLVCPPPDDAAEDTDAFVGPAPSYDPILAWHLGSNLMVDQLDAIKRRTVRLQAIAARPILGGTTEAIGPYGRLLDVLVHQQSPIATSLEMNDYVAWLNNRATDPKPRTVFWNGIQTQTGGRALEAGIGDVDSPAATALDSHRDRSLLAVPYSQLHRLVAESLNAGARGLVFASASPLNASTPAASRRARALELINLKLSLLGSHLASSQTSADVRTSHDNVHATVIQSDRVHIVFPTVRAPGTQYVVKPAPEEPVTFVIPGIPASAHAFELTPAGIGPIQHRRVAGGASVTIPQLKPGTTLLLTSDERTVSRIVRKIGTTKVRAAQRMADLTASELQRLKRTDRHLPTAAQTATVARRRSKAEQLFERCQETLSAGDHRQAYQLARQALHQTGWAQWTLWQNATDLLGTPSRLTPLAHFETLPDAYKWLELAAKAKMSDNQVGAGDMEDVRTLQSAGWQVSLPKQPGLVADAEISSQVRHRGSASLHLYATVADESVPPVAMHVPSVTVTSPPVSVEEGDWVEIRGWVRTSGPLDHDVDRLLIFDSIGGRDLATRIRSAPDWQPITMYRQSSRAGTMTLSVELQGYSSAWIDDVTIRYVQLPATPARTRPRDPALATPAWR